MAGVHNALTVVNMVTLLQIVVAHPAAPLPVTMVAGILALAVTPHLVPAAGMGVPAGHVTPAHAPTVGTIGADVATLAAGLTRDATDAAGRPHATHATAHAGPPAAEEETAVEEEMRRTTQCKHQLLTALCLLHPPLPLIPLHLNRTTDVLPHLLQSSPTAVKREEAEVAADPTPAATPVPTLTLTLPHTPAAALTLTLIPTPTLAPTHPLLLALPLTLLLALTPALLLALTLALIPTPTTVALLPPHALLPAPAVRTAAAGLPLMQSVLLPPRMRR